MHSSVCIVRGREFRRGRQQFSLSCTGKMARLKNMLFRLELNISFLMSHMPGENERAVVMMKNFSCENYVTNDHKLNFIQAQTL